MHFQSFALAIQDMGNALKKAPIVHTQRWQAFDVSARPEAKMRELLHYFFSVDLTPDERIRQLAVDIKPNLPWADDHFAERIAGEPVNPGETWKAWPWANKAQDSLDEDGKFNHNYMERYWPKHAGTTAPMRNWGIKYPYGDLNDLVAHLAGDPLTRQAYFPIFFPEDTANPSRRPCSLGYHFIMREDRLHISYYIRSCDFIRHLRDDIYLTVRLLLWVLQRLRQTDTRWDKVYPGRFRMDIGSLHCFINDVGLIP